MLPILIKAHLSSHLCGTPPLFDSLLEYMLSAQSGLMNTVSRDRPLSKESKIELPLSQYNFGENQYFWKASNPIISNPVSVNVEYIQKRFESSSSLLVAPENRRSLLTASGPYKSKRSPITVRGIEQIAWFAHGDIKGIKDILSRVSSIGKHVNIGYGRVYKWEVEECEEDFSIIANKNILMKTIPLELVSELKASDWSPSFGSFKPPYWHPDNYCEIAIPC
ncbi:putative CRISPR type AFERR-associated protein Csf3 [Leptospira santarosai str. ZUN179]|uniref:Putative CRISPR type AFERR-associated protein Csf3 n=1 Tax=Leptospira santarosai str. ZUN179 TaxID=1049985 RepID=M6UGW1_9LEPT|nr:putative CRISPR type AFERR-associated protein Csf3 [Leptospira santarosai str. ZUN179]